MRGVPCSLTRGTVVASCVVRPHSQMCVRDAAERERAREQDMEREREGERERERKRESEKVGRGERERLGGGGRHTVASGARSHLTSRGQIYRATSWRQTRHGAPWRQIYDFGEKLCWAYHQKHQAGSTGTSVVKTTSLNWSPHFTLLSRPRVRGITMLQVMRHTLSLSLSPSLCLCLSLSLCHSLSLGWVAKPLQSKAEGGMSHAAKGCAFVDSKIGGNFQK